MKRLLFIILMCLTASCYTSNTSSSLIEEDKLYVTRKYIGNFLGYHRTEPDHFGNPHLIWLETTMDTVHGRISAFSKECSFSEGERLYLRRAQVDKGAGPFWVYEVENGDSVRYMVNEYRNHNTAPLQSWFDNTPDNPLDLFILAPEYGLQVSDTLSGTYPIPSIKFESQLKAMFQNQE